MREPSLQFVFKAHELLALRDEPTLSSADVHALSTMSVR
jgi:hypothetical protein